MKNLRVGMTLLFLVGLGGLSMAQNAAPPPVAKAVTGADGGDAIKTPTKFERTQRLEEMRYQHLWIAYGLIWFLVFFFMFKTHKMGLETAGELEHLKRRLSELEGSDGAG